MKKLLIANRGEIAVRVIRSARAMGIRTVAVYSEIDSHAMHVSLADEAVYLGASEPSASYLAMESILSAAEHVGADAIHPGYGFLSENAEFADLCAARGLNFVGPPAAAMRAVGDKMSAKALAVEKGVPIAPGYFVPGATNDDLKRAAEQIGYPIMLKASAGGGGRGMRAVFDPAEFDSQVALARDEAKAGFGNDEMMVEKLIQKPRHIEVQIMADRHGNCAALYERECSIQRRHQKLIEEAPSPVMTDELWARLREASMRLAQGAGYVGAGTVEFMVDGATGQEYFLEVNARLQVEHPVTEAITGLDLVELQLRIADGAMLSELVPAAILAGDRSAIVGHSIEARIVAEDASRNFMPSIGKIVAWSAPTGPGIRVDTGYGSGSEISRFYDSLIAKVISHAPNRIAATERLRHALLDFHVLGVHTSIDYVLRVLGDSDFGAFEFDTGFLGRREDLLSAPTDVPAELGELVAQAQTVSIEPTKVPDRLVGAWDVEDDFRIAR